MPTHLRSSLHLNVPLVQQSDEFNFNNNKKKEPTASENQEQIVLTHPLDSSHTDEVLRFALFQ